MNKEEKDLLLKDLCGRLPYGVKGRYCLYDSSGNLTDFGNDPEVVENINLSDCKILTDETVQGYYLDEFKLYLRPMSSMTEEELFNYKHLDLLNYSNDGFEMPNFHSIDWLNSHHFDYRGLIEKGLAIAVTKENNPYTLA